jgi:hydrogenase maturation protease
MGMAAPVLILGLGNTILTDDGVGVYVARRCRDLLGDGELIVVREAELAGFALLDLLDGFERVVVVDAVALPGREPGEVVIRDLSRFRATERLATGHQIDLPTAVRLGEALGREMPGDVTVVGVQVADHRTLGEACTPAVDAVIDEVARRVVALARGEAATGADT